MYMHAQNVSVSLESAVLSRMESLSPRRVAAANSSLQNPAFKADLFVKDRALSASIYYAHEYFIIFNYHFVIAIIGELLHI